MYGIGYYSPVMTPRAFAISNVVMIIYGPPRVVLFQTLQRSKLFSRSLVALSSSLRVEKFLTPVFGACSFFDNRCLKLRLWIHLRALSLWR